MENIGYKEDFSGLYSQVWITITTFSDRDTLMYQKIVLLGLLETVRIREIIYPV